MKAGTTLECFEDLMGRLQSLPDYYELRKQFAKVIGVEDQTVQRWITGSSIPYGVSMIGLRSYLDFLGYHVDEFVKLSGVLQDSSRLLAFRVITLDEMANLTELGTTDQVLAVLRGVRGISDERKDRFQQVVNSYTKELHEAMAKVPRIIAAEEPPAPPLSAPVVAKPVIPAKRETLQSRGDEKREEHFKMLTLVLLDYARDFTNPELPEDARDRLREVVGQRNIFDLKNLLSRLCGSRAFSNQQ